MKKNIILFLFIFLYFPSTAQINKNVEIPETYELSNIILALTNHGINDENEVQKKSTYYKKVMTFFEPVKNHPLLDSVNFPREKWDYYLAFRTDAVAYSFDEKGNLKKDFEFSTQKGLNPFGSNIELINDFVKKSNFRKFYTENTIFYRTLVSNYENYNFMTETVDFLESKISKLKSDEITFKVVLSPLVGRMNCQRKLPQGIMVDFPSTTSSFLEGEFDIHNLENRLNSNHLVFTERDHAYINPITDKFEELVLANYNLEKWDTGSGYKGVHSFNEYMTWAVYDLFLEERFPAYSTKLSTYWQYQNSTRGFFAQNIFSKKLKELYQNMPFQNVYEPLLKWMTAFEDEVSLPTIVRKEEDGPEKVNLENISIHFSESMDFTLPVMGKVIEVKNGRTTNNNFLKEFKDVKWSADRRSIQLTLDSAYDEFIISFNWWGIDKPMISQKGIFLAPSSSVYLSVK